MVEVNRDRVFQVFRCLDDRLAPAEIERKGITSQRTAQRLKSAKTGFKKNETDEQTAAKTGWVASTVRGIRSWWEEYERDSGVRGAGSHHVHRLLEFAAEIRSLVVNPQVELRADTGESVWMYGGQDWRLTPELWFRTVVPSLDVGDEPYWGGQLSSLRSHLKKSRFWVHYEDLRERAGAVRRLIQDATKLLADKNPGFADRWATVTGQLEWYVEPLRAPDQDTSVRLLGKLPFDTGFCTRVLATLDEPTRLKLMDHYGDLETQLQQLWRDLDPDVVEPMLERSSCERCMRRDLESPESSPT